MLLEPTLDKLTALQLHGMVGALRQWQTHPPRDPLAPLELVGLLADAEWLHRDDHAGPAAGPALRPHPRSTDSELGLGCTAPASRPLVF